MIYSKLKTVITYLEVIILIKKPTYFPRSNLNPKLLIPRPPIHFHINLLLPAKLQPHNVNPSKTITLPINPLQTTIITNIYIKKTKITYFAVIQKTIGLKAINSITKIEINL